MPYRVTIKQDGVEYVIHDVHSQDEQIYDDIFNEEVGRTPWFEFHIAPTHPHYEKMEIMTELYIYKDGEMVFFGKVDSPKTDMRKTNHILCYGGIVYFADSIQEPHSHTGTLIEYLNYIIGRHNELVPGRPFKLGQVDIPSTIATRAIDEYMDTLTLLHSRLADVIGGYLRARLEPDGMYLDWVNDYGGFNQQTIRYGEGLLDFTKGMTGIEIKTCIIPVGGEVDITNPDGTTGTRRVSIESVNGGLNYIEDTDASAIWGRRWGAVQYDDVTDPALLLSRAKTYLQEKVTIPATMELTALDLNYIDVNIQQLRVGRWTNFESRPHGESGTYLLKKLVRHLTAPQNDTVTFGTPSKDLGRIMKENADGAAVKIDNLSQSTSKEINQKVENATNLITGGLGGYVVIGRNAEDGHPEEILIMDAPVKEEATNVIRFNRNGIGFSTNGYNGTYRNAWTIDGNLVADFVTTGTMLADRIRGGTLEIGGTGLGKDGSIKVYSSTGKNLGYWDKTGLHVLQGVIQGTDIIASTFTGGSIEVGPMIVDNEALYLGDYIISADGSNQILSQDKSIIIQTERGGPLGEFSAMRLVDDNTETLITGHHIDSDYGHLNFLNGNCKLENSDGVTNSWRGYSLYEALDYLNDKINNLDISESK